MNTYENNLILSSERAFLKNDEKFVKAFQGCQIGTLFSRSEIVYRVVNKYGCNPTSIIPSDHCYNRINKGLDFDKVPLLFEYTDDKRYIYLGVDYPYTGKVFHKPKSSCSEVVVGEWKDGKIVWLNTPRR